MPIDDTNPSVPDEVRLPDLHDAFLDQETVARLFADLETQTQILEVRVKQSAERLADEDTVNLKSARDALESADASGVQIRYAWQGDVWCDTLMPTPQGIRLIRMKTAAGTPTAS